MADNWIVIPDTHFPYAHPDVFRFLAAVADRFDCDGALHVGDLCDHHASSYHEVEPECYNATDELLAAQDDCAQLFALFPEMLIANGNHCDLPKRKCKTAGLPYSILKDKNDLYEVGPGWKFADEHRVRIGRNHDLIVGHYFGKNLEQLAAKMGCSFAQGHMHTFAGIGWARTRVSANFGMAVGCIIDVTHPAFNYHKARRSAGCEQLGCGVILSGFPVYVPMLTNRKMRWTGWLPT